MPRPLSDYAIIGDTHTSALVASDGSIDWLCWPRHDSPALFTRLLDEPGGGAATLALDGLSPAGRCYAGDTNVLQTRFGGPAGAATLTDLMPLHPPLTRADTGPDGDAQSRVVRVLACDSGRVSGAFHLVVTPDYGREHAVARRDGAGWIIESPAARLSVTTSGQASMNAAGLAVRFDLRPGEKVFLALTFPSDGIADALLTLHQAEQTLRHTTEYWTRWSGDIRYEGAYRDAVVRSALVLKMLTYSPTGGIVAAVTTSLPEAMPGNRNYDYRYSWVRDASFTVTAFCTLGLWREAAEYMRFLHEANEKGNGALGLLYGIDGLIPEEQVLDHLPGYAGVGPVRIGNAANRQKQHDIYGEFLTALHAYLEATDYAPQGSLLGRVPAIVGALAAQALRCRDERDSGIWELRNQVLHLQHSKAMIWVALDCAAAIAERLPGIDPDAARHWRVEATALREEYERETWCAAKGAYAQSYGSDVLDASVLRTILFGALDPLDPRTVSTLAAIERELAVGDLVYRYRVDDGQEGDEATFTACSFWRVGALALSGRTRPARAAYERLLARANDVGLFAEEIEPVSGEQRGNLPQGFTHMAVISHAVRLEAMIRKFGLQDEPG